MAGFSRLVRRLRGLRASGATGSTGASGATGASGSTGAEAGRAVLGIVCLGWRLPKSRVSKTGATRESLSYKRELELRGPARR